MLRHIVLVRFADRVSAQERDAIMDALRRLKTVVSGLLHFTEGSNVSPEGLNKGFSHGFTIDFADAAARDAYLEHPDHKAAGARLVQAAEGGLDGILVVDVPLQPAV